MADLLSSILPQQMSKLKFVGSQDVQAISVTEWVIVAQQQDAGDRADGRIQLRNVYNQAIIGAM
jgi:hypothetical protein